MQSARLLPKVPCAVAVEIIVHCGRNMCKLITAAAVGVLAGVILASPGRADDYVILSLTGGILDYPCDAPAWAVDDDLDVYLNGTPVYSTGNSPAACHAPIDLGGTPRPGDTLEFVVRNICLQCGLSALSLVCNDDTEHSVPVAGFPRTNDKCAACSLGCDFAHCGPGVVVYQTSFTIPAGLCTTPPSVFDGPINPAISDECYSADNCGAYSDSGVWAGDPVNSLTGNLSELSTDLAVPGRGRALKLDRTYNALDAAVATPGRFGVGWTDSYNVGATIDASTGAVTVRQEGGATVTFTRSGGSFSAPPYATATLASGANGTLIFTLKNQKVDTFDSNGRLIATTDRNGYTTTLAYNATSGRLTKVMDPAGRALKFSYGKNGLVSSVVDPGGRKVLYTYDASNNLISVKDVGKGVTTYTYDSQHRLLTVTDPNGGVTTNVYDISNRVVQQTDPLGHVTTWAYTAAITNSNGNNTTTVTDPNGNVTIRTFTDYLLTAITRGANAPGASTWHYTYDASFNQISATDPNGNVATATYDSNSNRLSSTDPLGRIASATYNGFNDPLTLTDPLGVTTTMTYDTHGNLTTTSRPLTGTAQVATTTLTYGDAAHPGDVTAVTDPDGNTSSFVYDKYGNRVSTTSPTGDTATFTYNKIGFALSSQSPRKLRTTYGHDAFGAIIKTTDPLGHVTKRTYDANHNLISLTDPLGHVTHYAYDADNERLSTTRADGTVLSSAYDAAGNLVSQTDALGHTATYTYDTQNRVTSVTDALGRVTTAAYDLNGNLISRTDPSGGVTSQSYDAANQLTAVAYSDGVTPAVSLTHDADGQRTAMTDGTGTSSYQYDSLHRLTDMTNGAGQSVAYQYDLVGRTTALTYPNGHTVARSFDKSGRLVSVTDWLGNATTFTYDPDSDLIGKTYPNTWSGTFTYDHADHLIAMAYAGGTQNLTFNYKRDKAAQLTSEKITAALPTSGTPPVFPKASMTYDTVNRLTTDSVSAASYAYDGADRLTTTGGATFAYDAADELLSITGPGATTFAYDPRGNRIVAGATSLTYDLENRLTQFGSVQYAYNGDGLRTAKTAGGPAEAFAWDARGRVPLLLQDGTTAYLYGPGGALLEQIDGTGAVLYYHADHLGSTRLLTDAAGAAAATYTYDAYGNLIDHTGSAANPFRYAGQYTDAESGFQYLRARYYDPATAQFLSRDPLVAATHSAYSYVSGNPINQTDPSGMIAPVLIAGLRVAGYVALAYAGYKIEQALEEMSAHLTNARNLRKAADYFNEVDTCHYDPARAERLAKQAEEERLEAAVWGVRAGKEVPGTSLNLPDATR